MTATGGIRHLISATTARVAALVLLGLVAVPATALASEPSSVPGGLAASPARIEVGVQPSTSEVSVDVAVTNRGPRPTHVHTALSDLVVTQAGAYETAPAGQTPYSAASVATIDR